MPKFTYRTVKRDEKRENRPLHISRGFLRKMGLFGKRILDFYEGCILEWNKERPD